MFIWSQEKKCIILTKSLELTIFIFKNKIVDSHISSSNVEYFGDNWLATQKIMSIANNERLMKIMVV